MTRRITEIAVLIALLIMLTGCAGVSPVLVLEDIKGNSVLTATFSEQDVAGILRGLNGTNGKPLIVNPFVDFKPGEITARGQVTNPADGKLFVGTIAIKPGVAKGWLTAQITRLIYGNYTATASDLAAANASLSKSLADAAARNTAGIQVESVSVTETSLVLGLRAPQATNLPGKLQLETTDQFYFLTLSMSPANVRTLFDSIYAAGTTPWLVNGTTTLLDGAISITGSLRDDTKGTLTPIRLTLAAGVNSGLWNFAISALTLDKWEVPASILDPVNKGIADGIAKSNSSDPRGGQIESLSIKPTGIVIRFKIPKN